MKKALITGITGQDGAYLAELLLQKGYEVHGIKRRASLFNTDRIDHLYQDPHACERRFILHYGDLSDSSNLVRIMQEVKPDEVYNLAAQSHVRVSFDMPEYTGDVTGLGTLRLRRPAIRRGRACHSRTIHLHLAGCRPLRLGSGFRADPRRAAAPAGRSCPTRR